MLPHIAFQIQVAKKKIAGSSKSNERGNTQHEAVSAGGGDGQVGGTGLGPKGNMCPHAQLVARARGLKQWPLMFVDIQLLA